LRRKSYFTPKDILAKSAREVLTVLVGQFLHTGVKQMRVNEVIKQPQQQTKTKRRSDKRTEWEKNAAQLRSKEARLNAKSPVPPIKHRP
jgi:hypothetical protein